MDKAQSQSPGTDTQPATPATMPDVQKQVNASDRGGQTAQPITIGKPAKIQPQTLEERESVKEVLQGMIATSETAEGLGKALQGVLSGVLTGANPSARVRVGNALAVALLGETWGKALEVSGMTWAALTSMRGHYKPFDALMQAVEPVAMDANKVRRIGKADSRAFDGVQRPVYQGGQLVGTVTEYSDRLAELLIKGDDPARYSPQTQGGSAAGQAGQSGPLAIQINVNLPGVMPQTVDIRQTPANIEDNEGNVA
jgi:hypothetical protein